VFLLGFTILEEKTIKVINTDFSIHYMITGGKVLGGKADF